MNYLRLIASLAPIIMLTLSLIASFTGDLQLAIYLAVVWVGMEARSTVEVRIPR